MTTRSLSPTISQADDWATLLSEDYSADDWQQAVALLPERARVVWVLRAHAGLTPRDVARVTHWRTDDVLDLQVEAARQIVRVLGTLGHPGASEQPVGLEQARRTDTEQRGH